MDEPVLRMLDPPNVCQLLRRCETGSVKNITQYNTSFLSRLIASDDFYFKEIYRYSQRGKIIQLEDKVFLSSSRDAYSIYEKRRKLYSLKEYLKNTKLSESKMLTYKAPICKNVLTPRDQYRPFLLIVTDDNHLLHFDFETGELLDSIYLGSLTRCKFSYIQWETFHQTISIASIDQTDKITKEYSTHIIFMSILPLTFIACFKIDSTIFVGQKSPNLFDGLLTMRGKCPFPDKLINIYSLNHILSDDNYLWKINIDQTCPGGVDRCSECASSQDRIVGREDHGVPVNVQVAEMPPTLLTVTSPYESFEYGSWPFHIIYSPPGCVDTYIVESLLDRTPIENGTIMYDNFIEDGQKMMFHFDSMDDRIIGLDCHTLTFFRVINHSLVKRFVLSCTPLSYLQDLQRRLVTCKKARKNDLMYKSIYGHVNDSETDIYCLMGIDISSKLDRPVVCLFNNFTGKLLKKFKLKFKGEETNDYDLILDRDYLLINETNLDQKCRFFCYQLTRKQPVDI